MRPLEVYERPHCACCGQLTTWTTRVEKRGGRKLQFCGDRCVEVFDSYLVPTHGVELIRRLERTCFAPD
jgi:hypothetical protein